MHGRSSEAYIFADAGLREKFQEFQLPQGPETKHGMIKRCDFLDCHFATGRPVDCRADDAIGTFTDDIEDLILRT